MIPRFKVLTEELKRFVRTVGGPWVFAALAFVWLLALGTYGASFLSPAGNSSWVEAAPRIRMGSVAATAMWTVILLAFYLANRGLIREQQALERERETPAQKAARANKPENPTLRDVLKALLDAFRDPRG